MKRLLLLALLLFGCAGASFAQTCVQPFTAFGTGVLPTVPASGFDNRLQGCDTWFLSISVSGFSAVSVRPDAAVDTGGAAGMFQDWLTAGGTMVNGSYPLTASTLTPISFAGTPAWVGVEITSVTGSGIVSGVLYGYRANTAGSVTVGAVDIKDSSGNNLNSTSGSLNVNVTGGSTGNGAASNTGSGVPTQADYQGINVGGTNRGRTGVNPTGSVYAAQSDIASVNGVTVLTGAGATGTGSQRNTVAQDPTTIAGSAPGTAGTPSSQVITVQGPTTGGTALPVSAASLPLPTGASTSANQTTGNTSLASILTNQTNGTQVVTSPTAANFLVNAGQTGTWTVQPGNTANTTPWLVTGSPNTPCYIQGGTGTLANTTNYANCKSAAGVFLGARAINPTSSWAYLRMYNLASAPTCSSSTGFVESIPIPPSTAGTGFIDALSNFSYSTGISYCVTGAGANNDNSAPPAGVFITLAIN